MTIKDNSNDQGAMDGTGGPNNTPTSPAFLAIPRTDDRRSISSDAVSDVPSEVIIKSRIHNGGRWSACKGLLMEYSKSTSIHGIRYLFEVHRPIYEKIFWLVTLSTSLYFGFSLSRDMYRKWQDSPVILAFDDTLVPVHEIPFPTITICPQKKIEHFQTENLSELVRKLMKQYYNISDEPDDLVKQYYNETDDSDYNDTSKYEDKFSNNTSDDLVKQYYNATDDGVSYYDDTWEKRQLAASLHICENEFCFKYPHLLKHVEKPEETGDLLYSLSETLWIEQFADTHFNGDKYYVYQMFHEVATHQGICYQFNGMAPEDIFRNDSIPARIRKASSLWDDYVKKERNAFRFNRVTGNWSLEDGYVGQGFYAYPKRTVFASIRKGLETGLDSAGFKMYFNTPESIPQTSGNYIQLSGGQEVLVSLIPQYVKPTPDLRNYEPRKRQCYFNDERYLRFFRQYSQSNCQTECFVNFTIAQCGCVQFWMPKPKHVSVCGVMDIGCYRNAQTELNLILQNQTVEAQRNRSAEIMCDCMPACTTLEYNFEISRARYNIHKLKRAMHEFTGVSDVVIFRVFFKERQFMAIKRTVLFSMTTLLANYGSICGLLMGISGLSLIELVYFVSLRLYNSLHMRRVSKKKLEKKLKKKLLVQQILVTASPSVE